MFTLLSPHNFSSFSSAWLNTWSTKSIKELNLKYFKTQRISGLSCVGGLFLWCFYTYLDMVQASGSSKFLCTQYHWHVHLNNWWFLKRKKIQWPNISIARESDSWNKPEVKKSRDTVLLKTTDQEIWQIKALHNRRSLQDQRLSLSNNNKKIVTMMGPQMTTLFDILKMTTSWLQTDDRFVYL